MPKGQRPSTFRTLPVPPPEIQCAFSRKCFCNSRFRMMVGPARIAHIIQHTRDECTSTQLTQKAIKPANTPVIAKRDLFAHAGAWAHEAGRKQNHKSSDCGGERSFATSLDRKPPQQGEVERQTERQPNHIVVPLILPADHEEEHARVPSHFLPDHRDYRVLPLTFRFHRRRKH